MPGTQRVQAPDECFRRDARKEEENMSDGVTIVITICATIVALYLVSKIKPRHK